MNDRQADLHYAFQFGQDAAQGDFEQIKSEFEAKFAGDAEARIEFEKGLNQARVRLH